MTPEEIVEPQWPPADRRVEMLLLAGRHQNFYHRIFPGCKVRRMDDNFNNEHNFRVPVLNIDYDDVPCNREVSIHEAASCLLHEKISSAVMDDHDELLFINGFGYHAFEEAFIDLVFPVMSELWYSWRNEDFPAVEFRCDSRPVGEHGEVCLRYDNGRAATGFDWEEYENVKEEADAWMIEGKAPRWFVELSEEAIRASRCGESPNGLMETGIEELRLPMGDLPDGKCRAYLSLFGELPGEWIITREQAAVYCALQSLMECQPRGPMPPRSVVQGIVQGWRASYLGFCWEESNAFLDGKYPPQPHFMLLPRPLGCTQEQLSVLHDVRARYVGTVDELLGRLCALERRREPGSVRMYVAFALDLGASPNVRHADSRASALTMLAERDDGDAIEELIKAGAEVDAADIRGMTALMVATERDSPRATLALLEGGASPFLRNRAGKTIEELAATRPRVGDILRSWMAELAQQSISNQDALLQEMEFEEEAERLKREKKKNKKKKRKERKRGSADGKEAERPASGQGASTSAGRDGVEDAPSEGASRAQDRPPSGAGSARGARAESGTSSWAGAHVSGTATASPSVADADAGAESDAASTDSEEVAETTVGVLGGRFGALGLAPVEPNEEPAPSEPNEEPAPSEPGPSRLGPDPLAEDSASWEEAPAARARNERTVATRATQLEKSRKEDARLAAPGGNRPGPSHRAPATPPKPVGRDGSSVAASPPPSVGTAAAGPSRPPASHPTSSADAGEQPRHAKPASFFRGPLSSGGSSGGVPGAAQAGPSRAAGGAAQAGPSRAAGGAAQAGPSRAAGGAAPPGFAAPVAPPTSIVLCRPGDGARAAAPGATEEANAIGSLAGAEPVRTLDVGAVGASVPHPVAAQAPYRARTPTRSEAPSPPSSRPFLAAASPPAHPASASALASSATARPSGVPSPAASPPGLPPPSVPIERPVHEILFPFPVAPPPPLQTSAPAAPPLRAPSAAPPLPAPLRARPTHAPPMRAPPPDGQAASARSAPAASSQADAVAAPRDAPPPASRRESAPRFEAPGPAPRDPSTAQAARDRGMILTLRSLLNAERGRRTRAEAETAAARAEIASLRAALEESRAETRAALLAADAAKKKARKALRDERAARVAVHRKLETYIQGLQTDLEAERDATCAETKRRFFLGVCTVYEELHADPDVAMASRRATLRTANSGAASTTATGSHAPAASSAGGVEDLEDQPGPSAISSSDRELRTSPGLHVAAEAADRAGAGAFAAASTVVGAATDLSGSRAAIVAAASRLASATSRGVLFDAGGFGVVGGGGQAFDAGGFGVVDPSNLWGGAGAARPPIPSWEALWRDRRPESEAAPQGSPLGAEEHLPLDLDPTP